MSEQSSNDKEVDLSALDFGPAWAKKSDGPKKEYRARKGGDDRGRKDGPNNGPNNGPRRRPARKDASKGGRRDFKDRKERKPRVFVSAEAGISAEIMPIEAGVDNLVKEITASGRTYSVFELARVVLAERARFSIIFTRLDKRVEDEKEVSAGPNMFQCKPDGAVFLTKEECLNYSAEAEWLETIYKAEELEVDPPAGNFQNVAKCGLSGEWLGPTNFHGYQDRINELHRTRFSHMTLENYKRKIVSESGEEAVNLWKESMTKRTVYKLISDEAVVFDSKTAMLQHFSSEGVNDIFHKTHKAVVPSDIEAKKLSPSLLMNLKEIIQDQRRYPGKLSSFLCRQLTGRQLAVYKWQGKLHCGPSRPHVLPEDLNLADRMKKIYLWIGENVGGGIDELWKAVCPDLDDKAKYDWYHDLHWLINQGYVVFMNSGLLFPSSASKDKPTQTKKKAKNKPAAKKTAPKDKPAEVKPKAKEEAVKAPIPAEATKEEKSPESEKSSEPDATANETSDKTSGEQPSA